MNKVREIMHNNLSKWKNVQVGDNPKIVCRYSYYEEDFDKLEKDLKDLIGLLQEDWISVEDELPKENIQIRVIIEHWNTKNRYEAYLIKVKADDHEWKVWDVGQEIRYLAELDMAWNVIYWQYPKPPITKKPKKRGGCNP